MFLWGPILHKLTFAGLYFEFNFENQAFATQTLLNYYFHITKTQLKYSLNS